MPPFKQPRLTLVDGAGGDVGNRHRTSRRATWRWLSVWGPTFLSAAIASSVSSGTWWWSDEIYTMHGWQQHEIEPGLEALRSRKHPDDRQRVVRAATEALRRGAPFACSHRIVDRKGRTRSVVVIGQGRRGGEGRPPELVGYVIDVTPVQKEALNAGRTAPWPGPSSARQ